WNPKDLANSEFLMWGHDNAILNSSTTAVGTAVDGTVIQERLTRIWRVSETGDVGNVSISFDFSGVGGSPLGSNLRLLIDRDGDGFADNDVTPIVGSVSNGVATFANVDFQNGDRFTLGNTDASSPLPVELVMFKASPLRDAIQLKWTTASELNNDFFTVERSIDGEQWLSITTVAGAGTTSEAKVYDALDYLPVDGISYYRLRQTDFDGQVSFSAIERVNFISPDGIQVFPNPSSGVFYLTNSTQLEVENIKVVNNLGQTVFPSITKDGDITLDLSQLSQGIYILKVWDGASLRSARLVKRN
ncbi:MAG: T9SS type A sorting domain-containing protein, partial [Cyclobacteriaceae bacterium]